MYLNEYRRELLDRLDKVLLNEKTLLDDQNRLEFIRDFDDQPNLIARIEYKECRFSIFELDGFDNDIYRVVLEKSDSLLEEGFNRRYKQVDNFDAVFTGIYSCFEFVNVCCLLLNETSFNSLIHLVNAYQSW